MANGLLLAIGPGHLMHIVPLLVSVSLVYSATRHEMTEEIMRGAWKSAVTFGGFLVGIFVVLAFLSWLV
jgi:uncharacterized membrane protein YjfL (UPF0719 family)